jgi:hypothetical protein
VLTAYWAPTQAEMLPLLLRVLDARAMTGSEAQRKLLLGHATLLAYCLRWQDFRARARARLPRPQLPVMVPLLV